MKQIYEIQRVMNNNVLLARHIHKNNEVVLMGKGIGFGRKKGDQLDSQTSIIEKAFEAGDTNSLKDSYIRMLEEVNGDVVEICSEILMVAEKKLGVLSERSFIVVVDHLSFAIEKLSKNIKIENPFVYEIERLYPDEFSIGEFARKKIMDKLHVDITQDEVGFIALHLHAAKEHQVVTDTLKNTRIIKSMVDMIERELAVSLKDMSSVNNRLLVHLRGMLQRIDASQTERRHPLHEVTMRECAEAYAIVKELVVLLRHEKKMITDSDIFYLTLHVDRIIRTRQ